MPHTNRKLDALNRLLFEVPDDSDAMLLSEFDGLVASLIVCPELIPLSEWLPVVWGGEKAPDFEDMKEAQTTLDAIMVHYNVVAQDLAKPEPEYEAILATDSNSDETLWEPWIAGFERGMQLRPHCWEGMVESADEEVSSIPPMILTLHQILHGKSDLEEAAIDHLDTIAPELIPDMVLKLNRWTKSQHKTDPVGTGHDLPRRGRRPGRNSPCPCGYGKKFKKCCGSVTLH